MNARDGIGLALEEPIETTKVSDPAGATIRLANNEGASAPFGARGSFKDINGD